MTDGGKVAIEKPAPERVLTAMERFFESGDEIQFFDPYLSVVGPPSRHPKVVGGYKVWPVEGMSDRRPRVMTIGNSTSLLPAYPWSVELTDLLAKEEDISIEVYHGAGKGNTSSQELLRVLRDAPAIKPDLIVSLSGVTDVGYLINAKGHPHRHKYTARLLGFLKDSGAVTRNVVWGPPDDATPWEVWLRNQRFARVLADEMSIPMVTFLQPIQGYGVYPWSESEKAFFAEKSKVVLAAAGKSYGQCVVEFYDAVRGALQARKADFSHVVDLTDAFADCPGAYKDHRHQSPKGVSHLARKMLPHVAAALRNKAASGESPR